MSLNGKCYWEPDGQLDRRRSIVNTAIWRCFIEGERGECCLEDASACGLGMTSLVSHVGCSDSAPVLADGGSKVGWRTGDVVWPVLFRTTNGWRISLLSLVSRGVSSTLVPDKIKGIAPLDVGLFTVSRKKWWTYVNYTIKSSQWPFDGSWCCEEAHTPRARVLSWPLTITTNRVDATLLSVQWGPEAYVHSLPEARWELER